MVRPCFKHTLWQVHLKKYTVEPRTSTLGSNRQLGQLGSVFQVIAIFIYYTIFILTSGMIHLIDNMHS